MKQLKIIIITLFGVFYISTINGQGKCPEGKPSIKDNCDRFTNCPPDSICFRENRHQFENFVCCGELGTFCSTNMHAYHSEYNDEVYIWKDREFLDEAKWYRVKLGNETIQCPIPVSLTYMAFTWIVVHPVDFDLNNPQHTDPKKCEINSDCKPNEEEFCDAAGNPTFEDGIIDSSGPNGDPLRFCYKFQNFNSTHVKPIINTNGSGLIGCYNNTGCSTSYGSNAFCFKGEDNIFISTKNGSYQFYTGVCATAEICDPLKDDSILATLPKTNESCETHEHCRGTAISSNQGGFDPECVKIVNMTEKQQAHLCCFKHNKVCEVGIVRTPAKSCSNFEDCNSDGNGTLMNQWCDYKGHHCCKDDGNQLWACPDRVTPLFNEPICNGYIQSDINSGSCPQDSGICKYGHCCPPLKTNDTNETIIGQKPYITNYACKPEESVPPQFKYAFCDSEKKKIVIMGEKDVNGEATVNEGTKCNLNKDCKEGHVCVTEINGEHQCFVNPLIVKKQESSQFWKYVIIGAIVCSVLFLIAAIIFFVYRLKSKRKKEPIATATTADLTKKTGGN